jgi:hypothetical protein
MRNLTNKIEKVKFVLAQGLPEVVGTPQQPDAHAGAAAARPYGPGVARKK